MKALNLDEVFHTYNSNKDIYHDLMQFKVRSILLVSTIYEAFILEQEEKLFEQIYGEYSSLNLSSIPRITSASSPDKALNMIREKSFDLVIFMMRGDEKDPTGFASKIREISPELPVLLLLNANADISVILKKSWPFMWFDNIFVWNGDSMIFLAMIKYIEDKRNTHNDCKLGMVQVILLVEDSIKYYSRYLPVLYSQIMRQTQKLISDELFDNMEKLLRMRARPKVLLAKNYEDAVSLIERFRENLLCVISDVKYPKQGKINENAGLDLVRYIHQSIPELPTLLQSSDLSNEQKAHELNSSFIYKNSEKLIEDLTNYMLQNLGFGSFVFRNDQGLEIGRSDTLEDFSIQIKELPMSSLLYHAERNHFSTWLMARGEIQSAKKLREVSLANCSSPEHLREKVLDSFVEVKKQKTRGKIINFELTAVESEDNIIRFCEGSLGGKCRGLAFLNTLIHNSSFSRMIPEVQIKIPQTAVIGTEEYEQFLERNSLSFLYKQKVGDAETRRLFAQARLSDELTAKLSQYLEKVTSPLAVRSSGIFEDSLTQKFSGVYHTYIIPNNAPDLKTRLQYLETAIKMVYASVFSEAASSYFETVHHSIEEERMAVIIQKVVGKVHGSRFYPQFSGIAQSYNYYPVSYLLPSEGIAVLGVGLGEYVLEGEKAYRFCPEHPELNILSPEEQLNHTQTTFYAIDLNNEKLNLEAGMNEGIKVYHIEEAEIDGVLGKIASVWDCQNGRVSPGLFAKGPRLINFDHILKYDAFPLSDILKFIMETIKVAIGTPVEIEFAVELNEEQKSLPEFYILQMKPLVRTVENFDLSLEKIEKESLLIYSEKAMGNGIVKSIRDIVCLQPENFRKSETVEMTLEIEKLNEKLRQEGREYLLIGPGRWGTRDRWLGIPVSWVQISNAKIIVEYNLEDLRADPSLGSHFFHNVISMNVGYLSVPYNSTSNFLNWDWLKMQKPAYQGKYFTHIHLDRNLTCMMDGEKSVSVVEI